MPTYSDDQRIRTTLYQQQFFDGARVNYLPSPDFYLSGTSTRTTERQSPGWKARIARGEDATTEMSAAHNKARYSPGYVSCGGTYSGHPAGSDVNGKVESEEMYGRLAVLSQLFSSVNTVDLLTLTDQQALARFVSDCRQAQATVKGMCVLGELGESLHMLRNPAKELRKGITGYVHQVRNLLNGKNLSNASRWQRKRVLRDTWLEYSFGWAPFINDIADARQAVRDALELRVSQFCTGTAVNKALMAEDVNRQTVQFYPTLACRYDQRDYVTTTSRYYGRVHLKQVGPEGPRLLSQTFGFSWQEFVPTVWELIPYSFLVDYFTNIGDIISVLTFQESQLLWKSRTNRVIKTRAIEGFRRQLPIAVTSFRPTQTATTIPPVHSDESKTVERLRVTWPLVADFRFKIPGLSLKWLNIAALGTLRSL